VQSSIILIYSANVHKKSKFNQATRNYSLTYTPIVCTQGIDQNLEWDDFKDFYALTTSTLELQAYAFETYLDLAHFLASWASYRKFKFVPLVGPNHTPSSCWRLSPSKSTSQ